MTLTKTLPMEYGVLEGKHEGRVVLSGGITRLSRKGAEIRADQPMEPMSNLKMQLKEVDEDLGSKDFYGKVIERFDGDGNIHLIRFTSLPPEIRAYFQAHRQYASE